MLAGPRFNAHAIVVPPSVGDLGHANFKEGLQRRHGAHVYLLLEWLTFAMPLNQRSAQPRRCVMHTRFRVETHLHCITACKSLRVWGAPVTETKPRNRRTWETLHKKKDAYKRNMAKGRIPLAQFAMFDVGLRVRVRVLILIPRVEHTQTHVMVYTLVIVIILPLLTKTCDREVQRMQQVPTHTHAHTHALIQ